MPNDSIRVLLVEDSPPDAELVLHELRKSDYVLEATRVDSEAEYTVALSTSPDVIICDWCLPQFDALCALEIARERAPDVPFIIASGSIGDEAAIQAMKLGATDYLLKDRLGRLGQAVKQAILQRKLKDVERRSREKLQASEARYRALAESIPQIVWTAQPDGNIEYINRQTTEFTGLTIDEVGEWPCDRIIHPDQLARVQAVWEQIQRTGVSQDMEFRIRGADGQYRWHICRVVPIRDGAGIVARWVGTCTDTHDQRLAAERLARDASILAEIRDSVIVTDLSGVVTYWNEGATRLFGWTAAEMVGQPYAARFPEAARAEIRRQISERAAGGEWNGEYQGYRKDGSRAWIDARVRRFDRHDGTPVGILELSYDITIRKRLEEQFRQSQKMEAVGRLAGGVAHDFNNLLTVINGHADLLLSETAANNPARAGLIPIQDAGKRAAALTGQLLAFSRKAIVAPRVLDLNDVIAQTEKLLRRLIGEDIVLATVLSREPCRIEADPTQLDQIILNLAVNARDAMPTGGRLTIEIKRVFLASGSPADSGELRPGRYVELIVSDTGCGMSDEVKAKLFEPFFTTKELGKGTGLGLAVVHGVVKQASGHIVVESAVGAGATFRILFPEVPPPAPPNGVAISTACRGTETILLVEDEEAVRTLCRMALESQGYKVITAAGGREALETINHRDGPVHMLVTDVVMPGMSGRELADRVRRTIPGVRVLYVSGYTDDAVVRHGIREATDAFLQKPFTPLGLARQVRAVLDGGS